jgi:hypothetical protein
MALQKLLVVKVTMSVSNLIYYLRSRTGDSALKGYLQ